MSDGAMGDSLPTEDQISDLNRRGNRYRLKLAGVPGSGIDEAPDLHLGRRIPSPGRQTCIEKLVDLLDPLLDVPPLRRMPWHQMHGLGDPEDNGGRSPQPPSPPRPARDDHSHE